MYVTEPLKTEKYWQATVEQEIKAARRLRNRKAIRDLVTFLAGLGGMAVGVHIVEYQHQWLPIVTQWSHLAIQQIGTVRWW